MKRREKPVLSPLLHCCARWDFQTGTWCLSIPGAVRGWRCSASPAGHASLRLHGRPSVSESKGLTWAVSTLPKCRFVKIISWNHGLWSILLSGIATGSRIEMCSHQKWQLGKQVVTARLGAGISWSLCVLSCFPSHPCSSPRICPDDNVPAARRATGIVCLGLICHGASACW